MNIRQGTDITNVRRIQKTIERHGDPFLNRIFTSAERSYCESKRMKYEHYAARFAAKEAVMKVVEVKKKDRLRFREIEVKRRATGKPHVYLSPQTQKRFGLPKKYQMELSMAHERDFAIATVIMMLP